MSIAVSVLTTGHVARNNGVAARQENRPQSATLHTAQRRMNPRNPPPHREPEISPFTITN